MTKIEQAEGSMREFVDVADVKGQFLYRKDGYILTFLRIFPYNLELLGKGERKALTDNLVALFKSDRKNFIYFSLPREVDMDKYKQNLKSRYQSEMNIGRRQLLNMMTAHCARKILNGDNYEHQHYIKIWQYGTAATRRNVEEALAERIEEFAMRYKNVGIACEVLGEAEIVKLCNLFGNALQATTESVDESIIYAPVMQM